MKDMWEHLEKLRVQIAECEIIKNLATDPAKRELFGRLAEHFKVLAGEIEKSITAQTPVTSGDKNHESLPKEE
jgi:hypothetical protein